MFFGRTALFFVIIVLYCILGILVSAERGLAMGAKKPVQASGLNQSSFLCEPGIGFFRILHNSRAMIYEAIGVLNKNVKLY